MMLSEESSGHPFVYARAIGFFHLYCAHAPFNSNIAPQFQRMDVAWVPWFALDSNYKYGFTARRLPRISFVGHTDPSAFGLVDPRLILRGANLIPAFVDGTTEDLLAPSSMARQGTAEDKLTDYCFYYVNM